MYKLPIFDIEENLFCKELFTMLQFSGEEDLYYPELPTRPVSSLLQANPALSRYYLKGAGSPFLQIFRQGGGLPNLKILEMGYLGFNISGVYLAFHIPIYIHVSGVYLAFQLQQPSFLQQLLLNRVNGGTSGQSIGC